MINLKPCPFCGSEVQDDPHTGEKYPRKSPMGGWIIHCECCGASLSQFRKSGKGEISWNTRPIEDVLTARIAELEAENKGYRMLIQDWIDIFDPQFTKRFSFIDGVRLAMIEAIKEREE